MTELAIAALLAAALVVAVLYGRRGRDGGEDAASPPDDTRVSPLLRGINYLLADEPDRALRELVRVARLHSESADVYLALGGMFRGKGELGRAVRIHQNLLARPDLPRALHLEAHLALGRDFQAGGLLDRALRQYARVLEMQPDHLGALEASLRIREQSSEWVRAEELLLRLDQVRGTSSNLHRAYLLAALAAEEWRRESVEPALAYARRAIELDPACAAAHLLLIEWRLGGGEPEAAIGEMRRLRAACPEHFALVVPLLLASEEVYERRGRDFLLDCCRRDPADENLALTWMEEARDARGEEELRRIREALAPEPGTLRGALRLQALSGDDGWMARLARDWRARVKNFRCEECGVEVVEMRWQCPQCHGWGTMRPITEEAGTCASV